MELDEQQLNNFVGKMLGDLGGAMSLSTARIGFKLGLFKSLAEQGPIDAICLAEKSGLAPRYVREWAHAQTANGYITHNNGKFHMTPEQQMVFVVEDSPVYMQGAFDVAAAMIEGQDKVAEGFRTGDGVAWGDSAGCLFCAVGAFFRPTYVNSLVQQWIPALDGMEARLKAGAKVADIGCGVGFSTLLMAKAFPESEFVGFDFHEGSIEQARKHAADHGVDDRVRFEIAEAKEIGEDGFDLVTVFDCLHDMGDPRGCASHVKSILKDDGAWMICEPIAGDRLEENLSPVNRLYFNASTMICAPTSLDQEVGEALGAQAGEARLRDVLCDGGFSSVRRVTEGSFNMILEARP